MQAFVFADEKAIKENSVKLGAGKDLHALFAGVLTMRPWKRVIDPSVDHLVLDAKNTDTSELQVIHVIPLYDFPPLVIHGTTVIFSRAMVPQLINITINKNNS
jgi:hypothetical protein